MIKRQAIALILQGPSHALAAHPVRRATDRTVVPLCEEPSRQTSGVECVSTPLEDENLRVEIIPARVVVRVVVSIDFPVVPPLNQRRPSHPARGRQDFDNGCRRSPARPHDGVDGPPRGSGSGVCAARLAAATLGRPRADAGSGR
ncbi:hypothetical protein F5X68DRAFT_214649 [Plectosphaerella plurivora]|uniref:Uncharacterized protein n=1 Tax=Plectosphaerella plurivora TaxID=936078 RepID=A0A9P8V451_9PEZI|nr:hypothetical protein F5X68DRAFT_214649 [Plectosphaerella plurivora]